MCPWYFCSVNEQHLDHILRVGTDWLSHRRGHSCRDYLPPVRDEGELPVVDLTMHKLFSHSKLGGNLKSHRVAAKIA